MWGCRVRNLQLSAEQWSRGGGAGAAVAQGAADTPLAKAVKILNNQLQALTSIEDRTAELEARLPQALAAVQ